MIIVIGLAIFIAWNDGGYWSFVPMVVWFVLAQIFVVPEILKKKK